MALLSQRTQAEGFVCLRAVLLRRLTHPVERLLQMTALAPATRLHADKNSDKEDAGCLVYRHASSPNTAPSAGR